MFMKTPKEKANEILDNFYLMDKVEPTITINQAKQCALICVDEILDAIDWHQFENPNYDYWHEVKIEIEKYEPKFNIQYLQ